MQKMQKQMMGHALLVMIIALLSGFMLADGLLGGQAFYYYGTVEGWARAIQVASPMAFWCWAWR